MESQLLQIETSKYAFNGFYWMANDQIQVHNLF